jgi:hypothetical protein
MLKKVKQIKKKPLEFKKYSNVVENVEFPSISLLQTCTKNWYGVQLVETIFCERTYILPPFWTLQPQTAHRKMKKYHGK